MSKEKRDIKKELEQRAASLSGVAEKLRKNVEGLLSQLKQQENSFIRADEEKRIRQKQQEQQELIQSHTKAWTMPDDEPKAEIHETLKTEAKQEKKFEANQPETKQPEAKQVEEIKPAEIKVEAKQEKRAQDDRQAVRPLRSDRVGADRQARPMQGDNRTGDRQPRPASDRPRSAVGDRQSYQDRQGQGTRTFGQRQGQFSERSPRPFDRGQARPQTGQRPFVPKDKDADIAKPGQRSSQPKRQSKNTDTLDVFPVLEKQRISNYDPNKKSYEQRNSDIERNNQNRFKANKLDTRRSFSLDDDEQMRGGKKLKKKQSNQPKPAPVKIEKAKMTASTITVKDLSERTGKPVGEILKTLLLLGTGSIMTINSELDFDTAFLVCSNFGIELESDLGKTAEEVLEEMYVEDAEADLVPRPPVITIMGHVDHGKTSLLDYIRTAHVTTTEAGGITQHIGAYQVETKGNIITFLDTPGHEAFTAMRARGANSTDIAVLVVAADDGVMPQTVEAINHARAAEVPIIVAINKMDKDTANPERIKQDLTAYNIVPEEWGGDAILVPVSAKTGAGVDKLLDMILLQAEMLELKANPNRLAKGIIIEAKLDKNRGPLATVLLQNGTLKIGDNVIAGSSTGRIRAMLNDKGERVESAGPAMPVEISGFDIVPEAGDELFAVEDEKLIRQVAADRKEKIKSERIQASSKVSLDNLFDNISEGKIETLNLIIKADVQGSSEAVRQSLEKLSNDKVKIKVLHSGVGAISKDDVNLATAFNAIIIGFNIRPDSNARQIAEKENVDIRLYRVIYQAIEDIEKAMKGMLEPVFKEVILGHAEVRDVFKITGAGTIAGSYVTDGKVQRNAMVRLLRDNVVIFEGRLSSLKRFKEDAKEVASSFECGIGLSNYNDIKLGDIIECYENEQVEE